MIRICPYCKEKYDTKTGSSMYCEENPNREKNLKYKRMKPSIVKIGALTYNRRGS